LICLRGAAEVRARRDSFHLGPYDSLYVSRDSDIAILPAQGGCDLVEVSAPVDSTYPVQFVRFADVQSDPALHFLTGEPSAQREVSLLLGKNIQAGRIVAGLTVSRPGNWTSWPPHEHAAMLEEAYLFVDMPAPSWGVQFVYTDPKNPELVTIVREGDCVMIPDGFHPNVAAPGAELKFIWMMAAQREREDRVFGVVNVQPDYAGRPSGLERGR
jgi:5-deoxy-glucuronate isomerase